MEKEMCQCIVSDYSGGRSWEYECANRAKETLHVETVPLYQEPSEPRTIHVCGVHARSLRLGRRVYRNTGKRDDSWRWDWVTERVRLPKEASE